MSPIYPGTIYKPLPEVATQSKITPRLAILHTNGGGGSTNGAQLFEYMKRADVVIESHFQIDLDGTVWQYMPVNVRADANYKANPFAVSFETQDRGSATLNQTPWTLQQVESIIKVLIWLRDNHGIQMTRCKSWDGYGVGAHRDFPEWSASAHSCPGYSRWLQVPVIIAAAVAGVTPQKPPLIIHDPPVFNLPVGSVPLYSSKDGTTLHKIVSPVFVAEIVRFDSGALGWANHAESVPDVFTETDELAFQSLMAACTVPPIPSVEQTRRK